MTGRAQPAEPSFRRTFERGGAGPDLLRHLGATGNETRHGAETPLRCVGCGNPISNAAERITVNGAHEHDCINPADVAYRIGCFRRAPGVVEAGNAISRYSWFRGFAWRLALCNRCGAHLGWAFVATAYTHFYGLILKRLTTEH